MPRSSALKLKYRRRDLDQIYEDQKPENISKRLRVATEIDEEKPALGQIYCLSCDKYFCDVPSLKAHEKGKPHKRRVKDLSVEPHTQDVADWAAGTGPPPKILRLHDRLSTELKATKPAEEPSELRSCT
ncbi:unnamed protein product [Hydatigera taeniaeformis]|uniref:C2H2-type domain-containing protein n=1 Tax=Hydatigena taeniaeformis TaxID=6205 RepID=A0A0R3X5A1_HYDTA|nr:unnamed protein product [Hydatigera taeniaeformis]